MWAERMRKDWQHTSFIAAYLIEVNRGKKGRPVEPDSLNPMESPHGSSGKGVPLHSPEGRRIAKAVSDQWQPQENR